MTLGQAALKWLLAEPRVVTTLPNIYDDDQLAEFAETSSQRDLSMEEMRRVADLASENFGVEEEPMAYKGTMQRSTEVRPPDANAAGPARQMPPGPVSTSRE
jgi:diketogulonate reductase-like aldo/keto reductase